ncbi:MAG: nucleotidyl transferase AbiEii/AbiGii toxin family protein [Chitinophagaceae bacterium]
MNTGWLKIGEERRIEILNQASNISGLPAIAIEKDWWVTLALKVSFELKYSPSIVFKGGTSLSKGWNLIERFSEDIDLAIDRKLFGFDVDISKSQIKNLRKKSCEFISTVFLEDLKKQFTEWEAIDECKLNAQSITDSDKDPQVIEIHYNSVFDKSDYLPQRVLIEVSSRSLMEPSESREVNSILSAAFTDQAFATESFNISTVLPQRTFLEKIFLLHEEFSQDAPKIRIDRLSRHLYDLEKLMDTEHGKAAIKDTELYKSIVIHREKFNPIRGLNYSNHIPNKIKIIPPETVIKEWEKDYQAMTQNMIYGDPLNFDKLIKRIQELQKRINEIAH